MHFFKKVTDSYYMDMYSSIDVGRICCILSSKMATFRLKIILKGEGLKEIKI